MIQDSGPTPVGRAPLSHERSCSRPYSSISGIASGLTWTVLQIGTATGLAPLVGIAAANVTDDASQSAVADGLQTVLCIIAAALALPTAPTPPRSHDPQPAGPFGLRLLGPAARRATDVLAA